MKREAPPLQVKMPDSREKTRQTGNACNNL
ncbi:hypothetical protein L1278_003381 [Pontibacter sp. HSC-36F09]|nr:hypothetical protein [Pontibacter sp. HSC-36F09]